MTHKTIVGKQTGTRRSHFCKFLKQQVVPAVHRYLTQLQEQDADVWLIMDNASIHLGDDVFDALSGSTITPHYQPPYAPTMNATEQVNAQMKSILRKQEHQRRVQRAAIENRGARLPVLPLSTSIAIALNKIKASDVNGYYNQCGYRLGAGISRL